MTIDEMLNHKVRYPEGVIRFRIFGHTRGKAMAIPQLNRKTGAVFKTKDPKTRIWEDTIGGQAFQYKPDKPIEGPIVIGCLFIRAYLKSMSKKERELARLGILLPTPKPDVKNLVAAFEDPLSGTFWYDDSQIVGYTSVDGFMFGKYYGEVPRIEAIIAPLDIIRSLGVIDD